MHKKYRQYKNKYRYGFGKQFNNFLQNVQVQWLPPFSKTWEYPIIHCMYTVVKMLNKIDNPSKHHLGGVYTKWWSISDELKTFGTFTTVATKTWKWHQTLLVMACHVRASKCLHQENDSPEIIKTKLKLGEDDLIIKEWKTSTGRCMTQARCYVLFATLRFFSRCRQSSGSASKLAFFDAFPL